ncbi:hypothetical protein DERP_004253 [Dermatophagoides pteronyssinus]|uniref:Uncharacterized protein n=1 Tax=Dermatophagoides pteronyssinus TaxID=6956 RepID=A0ABQ8J8M2_DERPT|nr:hypothetical protein DERP_004253 [Dermatophagoides pteronyssinus]
MSVSLEFHQVRFGMVAWVLRTILDTMNIFLADKHGWFSLFIGVQFIFMNREKKINEFIFGLVWFGLIKLTSDSRKE